jgi:hypothetical protein
MGCFEICNRKTSTGAVPLKNYLVWYRKTNNPKYRLDLSNLNLSILKFETDTVSSQEQRSLLILILILEALSLLLLLIANLKCSSSSIANTSSFDWGIHIITHK